MPNPLNKHHLDYATDREAQYLKEILAGQTVAKTAKKFGVSKGTVGNAMQRLRQRAASKGYSAIAGLDSPLPEGMLLTKVNTHEKINPMTGKMEPVERWVQGKNDMVKLQHMMDSYVEGMSQTIKGVSKKKAKPKTKALGNLMQVYVIGDAHLGLYAWAPETGDENHDLQLGVRDILASHKYLVDASPRTEIGVVLNVGDFTHANDMSCKTPGSGHSLDHDGRFMKVAEKSGEVMRQMIEYSLTKHDKVIVVNARGNHDKDAAVWLNIVCNVAFKDNPRVEVLPNASKLIYFTFGNSAIFTHHGDGVNFNRMHEAVTQRMLKDQTGDLKKCTHAFGLTGHIHHGTMKEIGGIHFESFNSLVANDSFHADHLYGGNKSMSSIMFSDNHGMGSRLMCSRSLARELPYWEDSYV